MIHTHTPDFCNLSPRVQAHRQQSTIAENCPIRRTPNPPAEPLSTTFLLPLSSPFISFIAPLPPFPIALSSIPISLPDRTPPSSSTGINDLFQTLPLLPHLLHSNLSLPPLKRLSARACPSSPPSTRSPLPLSRPHLPFLPYQRPSPNAPFPF